MKALDVQSSGLLLLDLSVLGVGDSHIRRAV